jgi:cob(I)alamin adenosyltransferase
MNPGARAAPCGSPGFFSGDMAMEDPIAETLARFNRGLVFVYTGDGKGKTTAAMGHALRTAGHGNKVLVIQFMKGKKYGEVLAAEKYLAGLLTMVQCGLDSFVMKNNPASVDIELAHQGLALAKRAIASGDYQMIILDEINVALDFKLVELEEVLEIIRTKPASLDLVLTGRYAAAEVIELADMVSDVREVKHHLAQGIKERAGIEY